MKTRGWKLIGLFFLLTGGTVVMGQDAERPGDNFSLEGALELFKKSESPEAFERMLNTQDSKVNNLDLDGDGYTDYIRVIDRSEGNIHTFTLQAVISDTEFQDVAVIALEKKATGKAVLQIIGDEDVYGIETIIEPTQEVRVNAGTSTTAAVVNVWTWPAVQYVYSPSYVVWISPWSWTVRPVWWYRWHPVVYYRYDTWWRPYRPYYTHCYSPRIVYASRIYRPHRVTSVIVQRRHDTQLARYRSVHRNEYTRSRNHYSSQRYDHNIRSDRNRESNSAYRPTVRTRTNPNGSMHNPSIENRNGRSADRKIERNHTPVQRERTLSKPAEREHTVRQFRSEQPQRQQRVLEKRGRESAQPRINKSSRDRSGSVTSGSRSRQRN